MPTRRDYDTDPGRYRLGMRLTAANRVPGANLHARIVRLLLDAGAVRVLDIGCGDGALAATAAGSPLQVIGIDAAAAMVRAAHRHGPTMRAEVTALADRGPLPLPLTKRGALCSPAAHRGTMALSRGYLARGHTEAVEGRHDSSSPA